MHHVIGPARQRVEQRRRRKGVVHGQRHATRAAGSLDPVHVGDPQCGVRHHLDQGQPRLGPNRGGEARAVGRVDEVDRDIHARQFFGQQPQRAAIELIARHHMVAGAKLGQEHRANGGHPRAGDDTGLGPLHPGELVAERGPVRMPLARIGEARRGAVILRIQRVRIGRGIDHRGVDRVDHGRRGRARQPLPAHDGAEIVGHGDAILSGLSFG